MNVISMVPSWTETLVNAQVNVVGRTRFCIHPKEAVQSIPVVGGTKDINWDLIKSLNADLLILDQEENLSWMKEQSPIPVFTSHIQSAQNMSVELSRLAEFLGNQNLKEKASQWHQLLQKKREWSWQKIPGIQQVIRMDHNNYEKLVYVIWKNPYMAVSKDTFIGSVLKILGAKEYLFSFERKYPEFRLEDFDKEKTLFLFSSEPFPFHKKIKDIETLNLQSAIINGESYSWFGDRSYNFLKEHLK